jgi:hypothetical protein
MLDIIHGLRSTRHQYQQVCLNQEKIIQDLNVLARVQTEIAKAATKLAENQAETVEALKIQLEHLRPSRFAWIQGCLSSPNLWSAHRRAYQRYRERQLAQ